MFDWNNYRLFSSSNYHLVKTETARVLSPFIIHRDTTEKPKEARLDYIPIGELSVIRLAFGAHVQVETEPNRDNYFIILPLNGESRQSIGNKEINVNPGTGAVLSPGLSYKMTGDPSLSQLILRLSKIRLYQFCSRMNIYDHDLQFDATLDLEGPSGGSWEQVKNLLTGSDSFIQQAKENVLVSSQIEEMIFAILLSNRLPASDAGRGSANKGQPVPYYLLRAERYMADHIHDRINIDDLSKASGVSRRTVFEGFRRYRDATPLDVFRNMRLEKVREELSYPTSQKVTITDLATMYGFYHLGSFSKIYREKFGESPSTTLKRNRYINYSKAS